MKHSGLMILPTNNSKHPPSQSAALVSQLKQCSKRKDLREGKGIHSIAIQTGHETNQYVATALVSMYGKCGRVHAARSVFDTLFHCDVVSWTALILAYVETGEYLVALELFNSMDCVMDSVTLVAALKACACLATDAKLDKMKASLHCGVRIHRQAQKLGFVDEVTVANTLIDMYSKCGDMAEARKIFDSMVSKTVVTWTALILGYVENGQSELALEVFESMDSAPDAVMFVGALKACSGLASEKNNVDKRACLARGSKIHRDIRKHGFERNVFVANSLIDMYSKTGCMQRAREVFDRMQQRDVVSWSALILGYVENGENVAALDAFERMECTPNRVTFLSVLKACSVLGSLHVGQRIHDQVCELGLEQDDKVASSLVDFYGKCGKMAAAEEVFNRVQSQDIVSWSSLLSGYSLLGDTSKVFSVVKRMQEAGVELNHVTALVILTACSHAGMVDQAQACFQSMVKHGISPRMEHYTCIVDVLGKANRLQEAVSFIHGMPFEANGHIWMTLLEACKQWSNVEIGKAAFHELITRNDQEQTAAAYVLMTTIYEKLGMRINE